MIKRAYILKPDSSLAQKAVALKERQDKGHNLFQKKTEWEALLEADWNDWFQDARVYINHVYGNVTPNRVFDIAFFDGAVFIEESDKHYTNQPIVSN